MADAVELVESLPVATMHVHGSAETVRPIFDILDKCGRSAKTAGAKIRLGMLRLDALAGIALGVQLAMW